MAASSSSPSTPGKSLEGRGAIVTGASAGIGREIAKAFAEHGAIVVVNYSSNSQGADETVSAINASSQSPRAFAKKADVSDEKEVQGLFDYAESVLSGLNARLHIVVNNAGMMDPNNLKLADTPLHVWERTFQVNARGTFLCSREAARRVVRGGGGRIINVTSSIVASLKPGHGAYGASKAAVETMTKILAKELRGTLITANCVAPGPIGTDLFFAGKTDEIVQKCVMDSPLERLGTVEDVSPLVVFLASDQGEWVNSQVVRVNGGYV